MKNFRIYYKVSNEFGTAMCTVRAYSKFDAIVIFKDEHPFDSIVEVIED